MKLASNGSDRLPRKRLRRLAEQLGVALALSATAFGADAAGLGRLNLMSALGQPLRAEIDLTSVGSDEAGTLVARLANPDAFSQAGIEYGSTLKSLRFSIQRRAGGQQYVLVTSNQQINDPFLDLLVELNWGSGRLVREYTVLLDPPDTRAGQRDTAAATAVVQAQIKAEPTVVRRVPRVPAPSANAGTSSGGTASAAASVPTGAPTTAPGGDYVVQTGDTASSIARADKVDGASLEQMLAALYRDNPQAFSGNINRLRAGASLKIPSAETARAIDGAQAHKIVAQSANFGSYRERLARNAAPAASAPGQQASGRLTTQVQDQATPVDATDRLRLSRPDAARSGTGTTGTRQGAGLTTAEVAEKDRELQESRTRIALLEKNVTDLQALIKLKNQALADAQKGTTTKAPEATAAAVTPPPASVAVAPAVVAPAPAPLAATPVKNTATPSPTSATPVASPPAVAETPAPPPPVAAPKPAPVKVVPAPVTTTVERGWSDWVMDNVMLVVAVIVLVLLGAAYLVTRRRKLSRFEDSIFVDNSVLHANSVFGTTGGQSVDTANSGFHSNFVPVAGALPEHSEVDPVAEADVYIAYGRDAQAEEILKEALRADGSRNAVRLKLLEIYAKRGDAKTFETMASELYASTGGQGDDWRQAAALGASIDPHNPLYTESATADVSPVSLSSPPAAPTAAALINTEFSNAALDFQTTDLNAADAPEIVGDEQAMTRTALDHAHAKTDPMPRPAPTTATSTPSMDLDFDLGHNTLAPLQSAAGPTPAAPAPKPVAIPNDVVDYTASGTMKSLVDPFTASAFGAGDPSARTAVNLPAFRARADATGDPSSPPTAPPREADGFTASDIFGTSIVADTRPMYEPTKESTPVASSIASSTSSPAQTSDFGLDGNMSFDKTEPLDAFSKVNLDLEQSDFAAAATQTEFGRTDVWQSMATKLDLALAYSDIGDKDGARELLEEVVRNGDQAQAERAKHLITELG